jgi:BlaI family transcriptional regulator, penicillinase repressor
MEDLTKNEEEIMRILWKIERGVVRDVLDLLAEPKPPYTTVSSVIRNLETKGYIWHKAYGKTYEYFPLVSKMDYRKKAFGDFIKHYFEGSAKKVVSFMVEEENLEAEQVEEIKKLIAQYEQPDEQKKVSKKNKQ